MFNERSRRWFSLVSLIPVIALAALLSTSTSAKAALTTYEGFNYTADTSLTNASGIGPGIDGVGQVDSFGWADRWGGANVPYATNLAGSMSYTDPYGNALLTYGGKVQLGSTLGPYNVNAQPTRSFALGTLGGAGNNVYSGMSGDTYWVSYLMQWVGYPTAWSTTNQYWRKGDITFRFGSTTNAPGGGTERLTLGRPNANQYPGAPIDTWMNWVGPDATGTPSALTPSTSPLANATFVVMKFVVDDTNSNDTVYTWLNWTNLTKEPDISVATFIYSTNVTGVNNIRLDANNANASGTNTVLWFDEFRLTAGAGNWGDVMPQVPEPSAVLLATIGGLGLLMLRQRRR